MKKKPPPAPAHLSAEARKLWDEVTADYVLEPHHLFKLLLGCEAVDEYRDAHRRVEEEGAVFKDRFGQPRMHPAVLVKRDARAAIIKVFRELGLDIQVPDARPPELHGRLRVG